MKVTTMVENTVKYKNVGNTIRMYSATALKLKFGLGIIKKYIIRTARNNVNKLRKQFEIKTYFG
jgi:hypothetical protein